MSAAAKQIESSTPSSTENGDDSAKKDGAPQLAPFRWKPGQSGNPGGRKKSLATGIRELIGNDGQKLYERMYKIWNGDEPGFGSRERLEAGKWLSAHAFGQPVSTQVNVQANEEASEAANALSSEQLESLARALKPDKP
jgi:hypothetical protein